MTELELKEILQFEAKGIRRYRERIDDLRNPSVRAPDANAEVVSGGKRGDGVLNSTCEIIRLEEQMQAHVDTVWKYLVYCDTELQRDVIKYRYIDWMRWEKIALKMRYSEQHVYRLHWQAMRVICNKLSS